MAHGDDGIVAPGQGYDPAALAHAGGQRLFDEDGNPAAQKQLGQRQVRRRGRGDRDGIDPAQDLARVRVRGAVILLGELRRLGFVGVHDGDQLALGQLTVDLGVNPAHFAGADHRRANSGTIWHRIKTGKQAPSKTGARGTYLHSRSQARTLSK